MKITSKLRTRGLSRRLLGILCSACFASACAGSQESLRPLEPLTTKVVEFRAEPQINNGQPLSVDVIYITYAQELREVTRIGPNGWFTASKRGSWKLKESVLVEGRQTVEVTLDPSILERTVMLVIYADYKNTNEPADKQVIVDFAGRKKEVVKVTPKALEPGNPSLRYVK